MSINRRAALQVGAAAVAAMSPTLARALSGSVDPNDIDTQLNILFEQFNRDARAIDPTITSAYIMKDMTIPGRCPVACVSFTRGEHGLIRRVGRDQL